MREQINYLIARLYMMRVLKETRQIPINIQNFKKKKFLFELYEQFLLVHPCASSMVTLTCKISLSYVSGIGTPSKVSNGRVRTPKIITIR